MDVLVKVADDSAEHLKPVLLYNTIHYNMRIFNVHIQTDR